MSQSRQESLLEAGSNALIGYALSVTLGQFIYPVFGVEITLPQNVMITGILVTGSLVRSYALRRFYESRAWHKIKSFFTRLTSRYPF